MKGEQKHFTFYIKIGDKNLVFNIRHINIYNILASLAVLKALNLSPKKNIKIFENFYPSDGRGKLIKIKRKKKILI